MEDLLEKIFMNQEFVPEEVLQELKHYLSIQTEIGIDGINNIVKIIYEYNSELYKLKCQENIKYGKALENRQKKAGAKTRTKNVIEETINEIIDEPDKSLNLDVSFYLILLKDAKSYEDIVNSLPNQQTDNYIDIINKLLIYYYGELLAAKKILKEIDDIELKEECDRYLNFLSWIKRYREELNNPQIKLQKAQNVVVFLTTNSGNVCIQTDIERDIVQAYYSDIKDLIESIKDGTFKNAKVFTDNKNLLGLNEVKYRKARVTFKRLSGNIYIILHAFIKKWDNDAHYRSFMSNRYNLFLSQQKVIKEQILEPSYLNYNTDIYNSIINILSSGQKGDEGYAKANRKN